MLYFLDFKLEIHIHVKRMQFTASPVFSSSHTGIHIQQIPEGAQKFGNCEKCLFTFSNHNFSIYSP